jgi:hypothetical protein
LDEQRRQRQAARVKSAHHGVFSSVAARFNAGYGLRASLPDFVTFDKKVSIMEEQTIGIKFRKIVENINQVGMDYQPSLYL